MTTLYSFCSQPKCADGSQPYAGLIQASNGNFYGTTYSGGAYGFGSVFKMTPQGKLTDLHSFNLADGAGPYAALVQATNGNFYGTTSGGGPSNAGTVFKIAAGGTLTTLHTFDGTDGSSPIGALVQGAAGALYGTTESGTVFKITPAGALTTLHTFDGTDGSSPSSGLLKATDGSFYGTTYGGGKGRCAVGNGCGTVFKITSDGTLTTLHSFEPTGPANPVAGLFQATDGNFYGTTYAGGSGGGWGTVFKITPAGKVATLHSFDLADGAQPYGPLVQATSGHFYGTATNGGTSSDGTIFSVAAGLKPFVETRPTSGKVGAKVVILGTDLTGATIVSFNGTSAAFTVVSGSEITTNVPSGATTGKVNVTTPRGALSSNLPFRVTE